MNSWIGTQQWDFVDAPGVEILLPSSDESAPAIAFPTRWRVFGPLKARVAIAPPQRIVDAGDSTLLQSIRAFPERLTIDGESLNGRDVEMEKDGLDLGTFCQAFTNIYFDACQDAAARVGWQIYAFAELNLNKEMEVPFGAGADYWMEWWIDGKPVYDTLCGGNRAHPPQACDHAFRVRLAAGKHLLAVRVISGQSSWVLRCGVLTPRQEATARAYASGDRWQFLPDLHEIRPPHRKGAKGQCALDWDHTIAIAADRCLIDETIECEFQMAPEANFGVIFGAQDSGHYYTLQIPRWGQLWRARTFWACLCVADGSGYLRILKMMLVPHVPVHWNSWIGLKVQRRGNAIETWIEGVRGPSVIDDTYGPGRAGLTGFAKYTVRNLKIDGTPVNGPSWKSGDFRGKPWFIPAPLDDSTTNQSVGELLRLSDDEILLVLDHQRAASASPLRAHLLSRDNGRTWTEHARREPRDAPLCTPWGIRWFVPRPGVIRAFEIASDLMGGADRPSLPDDALLAWRDSTDKGLSWSQPTPCKLLGDWKRDIFRPDTWNHVYGGVRLRDGTLLTLILHGYTQLRTMVPRRGQGTWGGEIAQPYVTRSEDDGLSWSQPVPMDNAAINDGNAPDGPHGGFSETALAELPSGRIIAQARPFAAPYMWRTHSDDGGKTWRVVTYEPFSGSGGPQLLCTRSGYLVSVKRGPALCMHVSTDGGVNWDEGTIIDYPASFNGLMLEVEPDVVLVVYPESMGEFRPSHVRGQLIRITPDGPVPLTR